MSEFPVIEADEAVLKFNFDPQPILDELSKIDNGSWADHRWHSAVYNTSQSTETDCLVHNVREGTELDRISSSLVKDCLFRYSEMVKGAYDISGFSPCRFNSYAPGKGMLEHVDHIHTLFPPGPRRGIPTLSIVGVVQEAEEGGEFLLRGKDAKLGTGDLLLFPSVFLYPHSVEPVISGSRISFVSWAW